MHRVVKETGYSIIDELMPMFIPDGEFTPQVLANELKIRMFNDPNTVCIIVVYSDDELPDEIIGFIVCVEIKGRHYLWLEQAYNKSGYSEISKEAFVLLRQWAKTTGKTEIRFETSPECPPDYVAHRMAKNRGFEQHSIVYSLRV